MLIKLARLSSLQKVLETLPCRQGVHYRVCIDHGGYCIVREARYEALVTDNIPHPKAQAIFGNNPPNSEYSRNMYVTIDYLGPYFTYKKTVEAIDQIRLDLETYRDTALVNHASFPRSVLTATQNTKRRQLDEERGIESYDLAVAEEERKMPSNLMYDQLVHGMITAINVREGDVLTSEQAQGKAVICAKLATLAIVFTDISYGDDFVANLTSQIIHSEDWVMEVLRHGERQPEHALMQAMAAGVLIDYINLIVFGLRDGGYDNIEDELPDWTSAIARIREIANSAERGS